MTFLEALTWMSESEENIALRSDDGRYQIEYKVKDGKLLCGSEGNNWFTSADCVSTHMNFVWTKSEPAPEEVEVVAYQTMEGKLMFSIKDSEDAKESAMVAGWRKVKVRFS